MALFINEEGGDKRLIKKQVIVPDKLVDRLKLNKNLLGKYKDTKGFKRISAIVDDDYNKRSNKKDRIHTDDKTVSFSDLKRIDHDMRHMSPNPNNLEYVLQGGEEMKNWAHDTLRKMRTAVKQVKQVPQVPKLQNDTLKTPKAAKDIKMGSASVRLTESENDDWLPYFDVMEDVNALTVLEDFLFGNTEKQSWGTLIDPQMYKKALQEFVRFGQFVHFPTKYIYQWMGIILRNVARLRANTLLAGHDTYFPWEEFNDVYENYPEEFEVAVEKCGEPTEDNIYNFLDEIGLYDWMNMPDGSDAWSDFGLPELEKIISEYKENTPPEKTIVLINRLLDCSHPRGDLASIFIVGGSRTLTQISESIKRQKKIIMNESQLMRLKEYHDQLAFNFDKDGNGYFEKNNYEHFIDFLESVGEYGYLPPSKWTMADIQKVVDENKDAAYNEAVYNEMDEDIEIDAIISFIEPLIENYGTTDFGEYFADDTIIEQLKQFPQFINNSQVGYNFYAHQHTVAFLRSIELDEYEDLYNVLTEYGREQLENEKREAFLSNMDEYGFPLTMQLNERGLIYIERVISIPQFDMPDFPLKNNAKDYYTYLKNHYDGIGNCFSWEEDNGQAYSRNHYNGYAFDITLKGWVDPSSVNWEETVFRNCYSLREEREILISDPEAVIELDCVEIDGKNALQKPILVHP